MNQRALITAIVVGTILQVAMVVAGHANAGVKQFFAIGGMGFSLIAGVVYGMAAGGGTAGALAAGGAVAGGVCAFVGILISHLLGDVPASLLVLGTISSIVTGAIGGWITRFIAGR